MTTFSELTKDFDPERRVRIEQSKEQLRQELIVLDDCSGLSATAKAILKAYEDSPWEYHNADLTAIEAVLRTVVDLVIPADALYARSCCEFVGESYRSQFLAIADELQKEAAW